MRRHTINVFDIGILWAVNHKDLKSTRIQEIMFQSQVYSTTINMGSDQRIHHLIKKIHWGMMTSSNGNIFRVTGPLCGEFTGPGEFPTQRPVTRSFGVFFDLRQNKRLSKQPWGWWFEMPSWSLWRQCNGSSLSVERHPCCNKFALHMTLPASTGATTTS